MTHVREQDSHQALKKKYSDLLKHTRVLEDRLQLYSTAVNLLSLELQAVTEGAKAAAKVRVAPRRPKQLP
ncbi:hypothetical protein ACFRAR_11450 [Kitasatospora sp. NPDC056651]|uniref:hypothetical protein n=1 Tax=Kitasatospora sp. NPDC056651 TaxID=3345892 RepID=UPI0036AD8913